MIAKLFNLRVAKRLFFYGVAFTIKSILN
jgi:hypothetical protein